MFSVEIELERQRLFAKAVDLHEQFLLQAKPLRTGGNFQFYEPKVKLDRSGVLYIYWVDAKIVRKKDGSYTAIVKHVTKGSGVFKYASNKFRRKAVELDLVLAYEEEFYKMRMYSKALSDLAKQCNRVEKLKTEIEW